MFLKIMVSCGLPFVILSLLTALGFVLAGIRNRQLEEGEDNAPQKNA